MKQASAMNCGSRSAKPSAFGENAAADDQEIGGREELADPVTSALQRATGVVSPEKLTVGSMVRIAVPNNSAAIWLVKVETSRPKPVVADDVEQRASVSASRLPLIGYGRPVATG